jgi:protein subunit release factor A
LFPDVGGSGGQGFLTVSSTALAVDLISLPTPRTVLAQAERARAQARIAIGAMRNSFIDGLSLSR